MSSVVNIAIHASQSAANVQRDLLESVRTHRVNHKFHYDSVKQTNNRARGPRPYLRQDAQELDSHLCGRPGEGADVSVRFGKGAHYLPGRVSLFQFQF